MQTFALITHDDPDATVACRACGPITAGCFLGQVQALSALLPARGPVLNLCADRYGFALALAACLCRGLVSLLPPAQAPALLHQLERRWNPLACLADAQTRAAALAHLRCPILSIDAGGLARAGPPPMCIAGACDALPTTFSTNRPVAWPAPQLPADQPAAVLFTSGSTGEPVAHAKRFGSLVQAVRVGAARVAALAPAGCAVLGTVPPQHMFGLEATVLLPMQNGGRICATRPFYPADIAHALDELPRPRALCSTPVHLAALVASGVRLPRMDLVLCATSPLAADLARQVERRCRAPLLEIFGSTETGQIASRRTAQERAFRLWPGLRLGREAQGWSVSGAHLPEPTALGDELEAIDAQRFLLQGRCADLVNIAGKRSSLAYLSHQLTVIPGVLDGAFFIPDPQCELGCGQRDGPAKAANTSVRRLAALAVAPGLDAADILAALRTRIDPVFLPRPLLLVARLPRDETGKLPRQHLTALATRLTAQSRDLYE